jgi:two-component system OmpR family sensor kinase
VIRPLSLRRRLLVAALAMVSVGLLAADAATYLALRTYLFGQSQQHLEQAAATVDHAVKDDGQIDGDDLEEANEGGLLADGMHVERREADGQVMTFGGRDHIRPELPDPLPMPPPAAADPLAPPPFTTFSVPNRAGGADVLVRVQRSGTHGAVIVVASTLDAVNGVLARLLATEAAVTVTVVVAVGAVGLVLVRVGLRPLDDIAATAAEIAGGDLGRRIDRTDEATEVGRLGRSLNEMLHQIEAAFAERAASEQALRHSEERLRRFVADASHELRTPLAAVSAYAELLDIAAGTHPEDVGRLVGRIRHESRRMGQLVADLLLLSRLDQGRPLEQEPVDLGLTVSEAVDAARAVDPGHPVHLTVDGLVEVTGDRDRLRQLFDNLLSNARVHTPAGTAIDVEVRVRPGDGDAAARAVVRVADHGPGIAGDQAPRIFERFFRADPSRARGQNGVADGAGTGLGLAIVAAVADAHGGTVGLSPTPGGGATFVLTMAPLEARPDDPATPLPTDRPPLLGVTGE